MVMRVIVVVVVVVGILNTQQCTIQTQSHIHAVYNKEMKKKFLQFHSLKNSRHVGADALSLFYSMLITQE